MPLRHRFGQTVLVPLLLATGLSCGGGDRAAAGADASTSLKSPAIGAAAPVLELTDLDGKPVSLVALKDTVVVLNVWATWCQPCRIETPELQALSTSFAGQPVKVIGVSIDNAGAGPDVRDFAKEFGVTYDLWLDPQKDVQVKFLTIGVPETFVLDKRGVILARQIGGVRPGDTVVVGAVRRGLR